VGIAGAAYDATWGKLFASMYDRALGRTERAGLGEMRRQLLAEARGKVLELGAGTGVNLGLYPDTVAELVLLEPGPHMAKRLRERVAARPAGMPAETRVLEASAERLPFEDANFETVVATLVLCTIPDPAAALAEARRVLVPGGRLLFVEHVRSTDSRVARNQDRIERPWRFLADGCHCNRDTAANLAAAGFQSQNMVHDEMPKALGFVRPLIRGSASAT
jgi:ubiquinone/menaquinone biosynthesis C-methylase UbiE